MEPLAIVVPLRDFAEGKSRLRRAGVDDVDQRSRRWAAGVIAAARPRPVYVACETPSVAAFAREHGARVILSDAVDLNAAVTHAHQSLSGRYRSVMFAHGDLRLPDGLGSFDPPAPVTIVADHRGTGTNVLSVPTDVDFHFSFGDDSALAHGHEAKRLGLECVVVRDSPWRFDVDEPRDLDP